MTDDRPADLPNFKAPPVDEVAIAVQFAPIASFPEVVAEYFQAARVDYPKFQYQQRIDLPLEQLSNTVPDIPSAVAGQLLAQLPAGASATIAGISESPGLGRRVWLVSDDEEHVLQLQDTWFGHNWRRRQTKYPQFEAVQSEFLRRFNDLKFLLANRNADAPQAIQTEVTYTNWVPTRDLSSFLRPGEAATLARGYITGPPEQMWAANYLVNSDDAPIGRLRVNCGVVARLSLAEGFQSGATFTLTFRSPTPPGVKDADLMDRITLGRRVIVQSFTDLTTESAHAEWGRVQ